MKPAARGHGSRNFSPAHLEIDVAGLFQRRRIEGNAHYAEAFQNARHIARAPEAALHLARVGDADTVESENLLDLHRLVFDAQHLGNADDFTAPIL